MNDAARDTLRSVLHDRKTAALATLHQGEPAVSMVPFAVWNGALVIHVSGLSSHTNDMLASPRVSVLVAADEATAAPQALPRIAVRAMATPLSGEEAEGARDAYLSRFPEAEPIFALGDFTLFALRPDSVRVIAGFGAAFTITGADFATALA